MQHKLSSGAARRTPPPLPRLKVPADILDDAALAASIAALPPNYDFEVHKTVWRLRREREAWLAALPTKGAPTPRPRFRVALQFPEGLLMFALTLADALAPAVPCAPVVMGEGGGAGVERGRRKKKPPRNAETNNNPLAPSAGDVAYGACCVDDRGARAAGAAALVHYGHSCLVPVSETGLPTLYVFVGVGVDTPHLIACAKLQFPVATRLAIAGTIQFAGAVAAAAAALEASGYPRPVIPAARPLSPGEVLGCTAPKLNVAATAEAGCCGGGGCGSDAASTSATPAVDALLFIADGRFHMEAAMIANPGLKAFRCGPRPRDEPSETPHRGPDPGPNPNHPTPQVRPVRAHPAGGNVRPRRHARRPRGGRARGGDRARVGRRARRARAAGRAELARRAAARAGGRGQAVCGGRRVRAHPRPRRRARRIGRGRGPRVGPGRVPAPVDRLGARLLPGPRPVALRGHGRPGRRAGVVGGRGGGRRGRRAGRACGAARGL